MLNRLRIFLDVRRWRRSIGAAAARNRSSGSPNRSAPSLLLSAANGSAARFPTALTSRVSGLNRPRESWRVHILGAKTSAPRLSHGGPPEPTTGRAVSGRDVSDESSAWFLPRTASDFWRSQTACSGWGCDRGHVTCRQVALRLTAPHGAAVTVLVSICCSVAGMLPATPCTSWSTRPNKCRDGRFLELVGGRSTCAASLKFGLVIPVVTATRPTTRPLRGLIHRETWDQVQVKPRLLPLRWAPGPRHKRTFGLLELLVAATATETHAGAGPRSAAARSPTRARPTAKTANTAPPAAGSTAILHLRWPNGLLTSNPDRRRRHAQRTHPRPANAGVARHPRTAHRGRFPTRLPQGAVPRVTGR